MERIGHRTDKLVAKYGADDASIQPFQEEITADYPKSPSAMIAPGPCHLDTHHLI